MGLKAVANPAAGGQPGSFTSLTVSGLTAGRVVYTGTGGLLSVDDDFQYTSGNLLIGQNTNPSNYKLAVNGNVGVTGTIAVIESGNGGGGGGITSATQNAGGNAGVKLVTGGADRWAMRTIGAADGESLSFYKFGTGAGDKVLFGSNGSLLVGQTSNPNGYKLAVTGNVGVTGGYIAGEEQTAPAAPAANGYRIFAQDNGAGKTQLMVLFASGAAQQIAIEP